ncbi:hypothetical protein [Metaclostridioides mangenotii]|uniref:hypothetical protein n=1 Tax=Metaclostridioides mangenotii TaxID=1540 RepID=UPI0004BC9A71|nr:hypothetical protein [Clostridioides mangenotii]
MLNYDYLVNSIVDELYKKINDLDISVKPKAVVLWPNNKEELETLKDKFEVAEFSDEIRDCDIVVVSRLCMRGLCNLASGNSTSDEERFILKMLMKGKKYLSFITTWSTKDINLRHQKLYTINM